MADTTTVQIRREVKERLDAMKIHPRESYNDILQRILEDLEAINPEAMARYDEIMRQVRKGKFTTDDDLRRELGL
jgi:hypothetical protein